MEELLVVNNCKFNIIANSPDGENINLDSGATHTNNLINNYHDSQYRG